MLGLRTRKPASASDRITGETLSQIVPKAISSDRVFQRSDRFHLAGLKDA